jgi:hypothetical protein
MLSWAVHTLNSNGRPANRSTFPKFPLSKLDEKMTPLSKANMLCAGGGGGGDTKLAHPVDLGETLIVKYFRTVQ